MTEAQMHLAEIAQDAVSGLHNLMSALAEPDAGEATAKAKLIAARRLLRRAVAGFDSFKLGD